MSTASPELRARRSPAVRLSVHVEPIGTVATARHYIRDLIYGANDGIITTFAVVAAVTGGALSARAVLIVGIANLLADGLSMGVGSFLSIRAHESALAAQFRPEEEAYPARHGFATFLAFVAAGTMPLLPYGLPLAGDRFVGSVICTAATLFGVGAARASVTTGRWWSAGAEMLALGTVVAAAAYGSGALVAGVLGSSQ
jgi:VIT1/CCC1 family predicted Fe2+/Mn2+ transporter